MNRLLKIPRVGGDADDYDYILVQVTSQNSSASDLTCQITTTENTKVFSILLQHDKISKLRHKNSPVNSEEWEQILSALLLGNGPENGRSSFLDGVEAIGQIDNSSMIITVQRRIEGITQRLGSMNLLETKRAEDEPDLYDWCGKSIAIKDESLQELEKAKGTLGEKDTQIRMLEKTLAELTNLKNRNENQMLEKFSLLLNEKKLKIRDQQRLLASSNADSARVENVVTSRSGKSGSAGSSRKGKRKARNTAAPSDDESDGFEKMEIDKDLDASDREQQQTPDRSEVETASEEDAQPVPKLAAVMKKVAKGKAKVSPPKALVLAVPPKRELPFAMKPSVKLATAAEDSETESDNDDEL